MASNGISNINPFIQKGTGLNTNSLSSSQQLPLGQNLWGTTSQNMAPLSIPTAVTGGLSASSQPKTQAVLAPQTNSGILPSATLASNSQNNSATPFSQATEGLISYGAGGTPYYNQAQNQSQAAQQGLISTIPQNSAAVQEATQNLQALQNEYADTTSSIGNSPWGLSEQGGVQGLINSQFNTKQSAAEQALQNALTGNAQTQAAYTGAGNLANAAAGNSTSQQGTQQSALGAAGGLSAPTTASPYGVYRPDTGEYQSYAGGAAGAGGVQQQVQQGAAIQQMTGQQAQAQALANNLAGVIQSAGINPASPGNAGPMTNYVNGALQWINKNTGDPQYQNFANLINEIATRYASILNQSGGTPTDQSTLSHQIINGLASGESIIQVLNSLDKNASDSINALKNASASNSAQNNGTNTTVSGYSGWGAQ